MAVKKVSAKKPAKKAVAKKAVAKKAVKKAAAQPAKKAPVKKVAKKATAKKAAVKKSAVKKSVVKKSAVKKAAVKKSAIKKSAVKKAAAKKEVLKFDIPEAPVVVRPSRVEVVSTPPPAPIIAPIVAKPAPKASGPSSRVVVAVALGIIVLVAIVWAKSGHKSDDAVAKPSTSTTITADPSTTPSTTASATPSTTATTIAAHEAPQGIVAHYTATGATIFWNAPTATDGLTGYNVEISVGGGVWKTISTVPATTLTQDVTKDSAQSWTSFKVSSVYSDSVTTAGKVFGLPGTFS